MFVYAWRLARRIGLLRVAIALALLGAVALGGAYYLIHKSPQQKMDIAEAVYDNAMADRAFPYASAMMRQALAIDENEPRFWLKLGRSELAQGSYQGALEAYSRVLDYDPENVEALQAVAELSVAGGNYDDAKDYVARLLQLQPDDVRGRITEAAVSTRERRFADADRQIQALIARGIQTDDVYLLQSRIRSAQNDVIGGIRILEARDKVTPGSPGILGELAVLYGKAGDVAGLRRTRARLLALDPTNVGFQLSAAEDLAADGKADEARAAVEQVQTSGFENPDTQLQVIDYWRGHGDAQAALAAARRAGAAGGEATRIAVAQRLIDLGQPGEALALIEPITAQIGDRKSSGATAAWVVNGNALLALARLDEARAIADRLLAYDETNSPVLSLRTKLAIAQKQYDTALIDAQLLVQNQPGALEPLLLLGRVQALRGDRPLADLAYANARRAFPDSLAALRASIDYLVGQGRRREAGNLLLDFGKRHSGSREFLAMAQDICRRTPLPVCPKQPG